MYAETHDVEFEVERPFSDVDTHRAGSLITAASRLLDQFVTVDRADPEQMGLAKIVVVDMVAEALAPGEYRGHQSYSWRNGALAGSGTLVATAGALRLLDWHLAMFGAPSALSPSWHFGDEVG
ncbi:MULTISPECIES: hypothetical protein [Actinomycetes]|uniref:hypothetical protein n=1 Tax=Actinomycetes TaxID=1760 RepID=UPI000849547A|nr:hypothetical protein [Dietzia sp. KRD202]ODQ97047.1 hypothetical protein BFG51_02695 [Dietzia alimentaria]